MSSAAVEHPAFINATGPIATATGGGGEGSSSNPLGGDIYYDPRKPPVFHPLCTFKFVFYLHLFDPPSPLILLTQLASSHHLCFPLLCIR